VDENQGLKSVVTTELFRFEFGTIRPCGAHEEVCHVRFLRAWIKSISATGRGQAAGMPKVDYMQEHI
jgi:hypothetical protein